MREMVGPTEESFFDNPTGGPVFRAVSLEQYACVFDLGCGCGRLARQLIQQEPRPGSYVGVDPHLGMVKWCRENLQVFAPEFAFHHHDIFHQAFNPSSSSPKPAVLALPVPDGHVTLFIAWSVFTHVTERAADFYLQELSRVLHPDGVAITTWFLFDKRDYPMMQDFQNALFINDLDPTNAVIFDRAWLRRRVEEEGLVIADVKAPAIRGFQWEVRLTRGGPSRRHVDFPEDAAPRGSKPPPLSPSDADKIGL
jgi:SAM-dependent methyltransferase